MRNHSRSKRRFKARGCLILVAGGAALLAVLLVVVYVIQPWMAGRKVARQLDQLQRDGMPTTADQLHDFYAARCQEAGVTALWREAGTPLGVEGFFERVEELPIIGLSQAPIPPVGQDWTQLAEVEAVLADFSVTMQNLHAAAATGRGGQYELRFEDGVSMDLTDHLNLRKAARMLVLEAHLRAHQGDPVAAAQSIRTCLLLARSMDNDPLLISQLIGRGIDHMAYLALIELLAFVELDEDELVRIQEVVRKANYRNGLQRALIGERALGIAVLQQPPSPWIARLLPTRNAELLLYLNSMEEMIRCLDDPWPQAVQNAHDFVDELNQQREESLLEEIKHAMTDQLTPDCLTIVHGGLQATTLQNMMDTVLAIQRYRRVEGELPETIQSLVPQYLPSTPLDPYDGKPLRYWVFSDEILVYSVGRDGQDDGGRSTRRFEPDVVFRLPLVEK